MKVFLVFFAASIAAATASTCPTKKIYKQPNCLPKSEYHPYWQSHLKFTSPNGPCFEDTEPVSSIT